MTNDDNFDLVLAIPCWALKDKKKMNDISELARLSLEQLSGSHVKCGNSELEIKNATHDDNKSYLSHCAQVFCEQIYEHSNYELVYNDDSIEIKRKPLLYGNVIVYEDDKIAKFIPKCCYNFFCVLSELTVAKVSSSENDLFTIVYFVVRDINYFDLTLLMDQSHELWCNIAKNIEDNILLTDYLNEIGYKYFGKIYHIIFSDKKQFENITDGENNTTRLFNILAAETYKDEATYSHQLELSETANTYQLSVQGNNQETKFTLIKKDKFYDAYNMYSSYKAFASIYSYYYIIDEEGVKDVFSKRIEPDDNNEGFSSEANILFVLETEIFKITACLVLSKTINDQIINNNPNMREIQKMFESFINTRPLFEKLNYRYLGAQKEADFIYERFRIRDIIADYDKKRELLQNYTEVSNTIIVNRNSKIMQFIGLLFTFISGFSILRGISGILFDNQTTLTWSIEYILPIIVFVIITINFVPFKKLFKKNRARSA
jgi:hypothetical protein